jgi:hypothetical protein
MRTVEAAESSALASAITGTAADVTAGLAAN